MLFQDIRDGPYDWYGTHLVSTDLDVAVCPCTLSTLTAYLPLALVVLPVERFPRENFWIHMFSPFGDPIQ